ncbi:MAG TPA: alpha/beta hydrolase [Burkholderiales bacterium]|nr:alpha/beta hydrolase [Burkholderiales bacterium]
MPTLKLPDMEMHYVIDDFTDPWTTPETILLMHGNAESALAWNAWVPHLARRYRVMRPDRRGFGQSTPMPRDFEWSFDVLIDDHIRLMDALGIERFHLVAAKWGGTLARVFAARRPERLATLTVIGTPAAARPGGEVIPKLQAEFEQRGLKDWIQRTMGMRLGSKFPPEATQYWIDFMSRAPVSTLIGFQEINYADISAEIPKIKAPTLVITTEGSGLASIEENRAWQEKIPNSRLLVLPGDSYHVALTDPATCAQATLEFIAASGAH